MDHLESVEQRAPYGRIREQPIRNQPEKSDNGYRGETYYDRPALKPSHYGELVAGYLFIGGIAGAAQVIATAADLVDGKQFKALVRAGRSLAVAGALGGPALLIADLRTPRRWYNMLRIFRRTSSMSIGSWTLALFGTVSAATLAADLLADGARRSIFRRIARLLGFPAAAAGSVVATYTGTLLGATSTPLWAASHPFLPMLFGTSATATGTAALTLLRGGSDISRREENGLRRLMLISAGAEWLISRMLDEKLRSKELGRPLLSSPQRAAAYKGGYRGIGIAAPLIIEGLSLLKRRRSRRLSVAAAVATLVGGYVLRSVLLSAGKASAHRPTDYFKAAQP